MESEEDAEGKGILDGGRGKAGKGGRDCLNCDLWDYWISTALCIHSLAGLTD